MIHSLTSYLIGNLKEINPWARIRRHQAIELFEKRRTLSWPVLMRGFKFVKLSCYSIQICGFTAVRELIRSGGHLQKSS